MTNRRFSAWADANPDELENALRSMPAQVSKAMRLRYVEHRPVWEIAKSMHCSQENICRALQEGCAVCEEVT